MAARANTETPDETTPEEVALPTSAADRYVTAAAEPTSDQLAVVRQTSGVIATAIEQFGQLPDGAHKDRAILALEEAEMWANKAALA